MEVMNAIKSRKPVRSYTGTPISDEQLQRILSAAQAAPVGMGAYDSLQLTIVKNRDLLEKISANAQAVFGRDADMLYGAPTLMLVSTTLSGMPQDNVACSNAAVIVQNMVLEAVELGVGACHIWGATIALSGNAELVASLGLKEGYTPVCGVVLGVTDESYAEREISDRIAANVID